MFRTPRWWFTSVAMVVLLFASMASLTQAAPPTRDYRKLDAEIKQMHEDNLFTGGKEHEGKGKGDKAVFDVEEARKRKYSAESIAIAEQLVAFSNDISASLSDDTPGIQGSAVNVRQSKYSALDSYFQAMAAQVRGGEGAEHLVTLSNDLTALLSGDTAGTQGSAVNVRQSKYSAPDSHFRATTAQAWGGEGAEPMMMVQSAELFGRTVCGWYTNPKPSTKAPWTTHYSWSATETLKSWGYHPTPNLVGGGWTRARTWKSWACGWGTFRDHAYTVSTNKFYEQYYGGWSPNGEPNPEIYRSGPWPYSDWPAYVYWWHQYGPGR